MAAERNEKDMGNRALVVFVDGEEASPTIYLHWGGSKVHERLRECRKHMQGRTRDVSYAAARFVGLCHAADADSNLSLGIWSNDGKVAAIQDHGDAGVFVVTLGDDAWTVTNRGGSASESHWPAVHKGPVLLGGPEGVAP